MTRAVVEVPSMNWNDFDLPLGWAGEVSYANTMGFSEHMQLYLSMIEWLKCNVANVRRDCKWIKIGDCIYVQFRKKKDMTWFVLRFGQ